RATWRAHTSRHSWWSGSAGRSPTRRAPSVRSPRGFEREIAPPGRLGVGRRAACPPAGAPPITRSAEVPRLARRRGPARSTFTVALDLHAHAGLVEHADGRTERVPLTPDRPVAEVTRELLAAVRTLAGPVEIDTTPQETHWSVPLDEDRERARYETDRVRDYF